MKLKPSVVQFVKFAFVGIINTGVDWLVFFLLIRLVPFFAEFSPLAKAISFVLAAINSFVMNSAWTFSNEFKSGFSKNDSQKISKGSVYFGRFFAVSVVGLIINTLVYSIVLSIVPSSFSATVIKLAALTCASGAGIIWNFFANKFWTYKKVDIAEATAPERRKRLWFNLIGVLLLGIMAAISVLVMFGDSGTVDEVAHIPSGYSYLKYHDYRLNPEHPPLTKAIAGIPLQFIKVNELTNSPAWNDINQWESGWDFIYRLGNNPDAVINLSRIPIIILLLILGVFVYRFTRELAGRKVAVIVLTLFAFYPDLLAHGHLVTTDVAAALGFVLSIYYFWHWTNSPTKKNLVYAGLAFGIAQLLKFSAVLLIPVLILYLVFLAFSRKSRLKGFWHNFRPLLVRGIYIGLIGLAAVWLVYIPFVWNTPAGIEHKLIEANLTNDARTLVFRNFLHLLEGNPITRAIGHYILGLFLVFGRVGGGNSTFILGHFSDKGISWYFPVAWLIKTPLPVILLFWGGLLAMIKKFRANTWIYVLLLTPVAIYWAVTLKGSLNIGIRHLMPTIPFVLIFIGFQLKNILNAAGITWPKVMVGLLAVWMIVGSLIAYPNYISYFNELTYGRNKYDLLVDSSLDWGQDLKRLAKWVDDNHVQGIYIDYFGGSVPSYFIPHSASWRSGYGPVTGYIAISATFYQFSRMYGQQEGKWSYDWLRDYQPVAVIGNSILVFQVTPADMQKNPPKSPYPITKYDRPEPDITTPSANN